MITQSLVCWVWEKGEGRESRIYFTLLCYGLLSDVIARSIGEWNGTTRGAKDLFERAAEYS